MGFIVEQLGQFSSGFIQPLLLWMRIETVGPALAGLITICGILVLISLAAGFVLDSSLLQKALKTIGDRNEREFAKEFNVINQDLAGIKRIGPVWNEFCETLVAPQFDADGKVRKPCENTMRPHDFFNSDDLGMGPNFSKVFPSVFVGIGLSLTFLGLISALGIAVDGIKSADVNTSKIQDSISGLLLVSAAKFYASLFALFMSVLITVALRLVSWKLNQKIEEFNRKLESVVRFLSNEKLVMNGNLILENQLTQLQTFNTDLAMKIGEQVQSSLSRSLAPVIQKLDTMGGDMAQQNIDAIKSITEEVVQGIQGATAGSMDRVAETLDKISEKLGSLSEVLGGALSNFDADFRTMLEGLKGSLQESTNVAADGISNSILKMSEGIGSTAEQVTEIVGGLTSSIQHFADLGADISKKGGEELKRQVEVASEHASEQIAKAGRELSLGFRETTNEMVESLKATTSQLRELEEGLTNLPATLGDVNTKLTTSAVSIGTAADQFSLATSSLRDLIEPLAQYASDTRDSITEASKAMELVSTQMSQATSEIENAIKVLDDKVTSQLDKLDGADSHLAELLQGMEQSTTRVLSQINEFVTKVDGSFGSSLGLLRETLEELSEVVEALRAVSEESRTE